MGKYTGKVATGGYNTPFENEMLRIQEKRADEAAELNRLKRLEIRVKINTSPIEMSLRKSFLNEVGDQA